MIPRTTLVRLRAEPALPAGVYPDCNRNKHAYTHKRTVGPTRRQHGHPLPAQPLQYALTMEQQRVPGTVPHMRGERKVMPRPTLG